MKRQWNQTLNPAQTLHPDTFYPLPGLKDPANSALLNPNWGLGFKCFGFRGFGFRKINPNLEGAFVLMV